MLQNNDCKVVGFDLTAFVYGKAAGFNEFTQSLLQGLVEVFDVTKGLHFVFYVREDQLKHFDYLKSKYEVIPVKANSVIGRVLWQNICLPWQARRYSLMVFPANFAPLFMLSKYLLVIHDLNFLKFPQNFSRLSLFYRKTITKRSILKSTQCVAISEVVAKEIYEYTNKSSVVIKNAVRMQHKTSQPELEGNSHQVISSDQLVLCPSSIAVHKNIAAAYEAAVKFEKLYPNVKFCFIGNWQVQDFPGQAIDGRIEVLGYVSDEEKLSLLNKTSAILFPSVYEGFGMPYIEALGNRKTLICADIPIAREIAGDKPVYIASPYTSSEIFDALKQAYDEGFYPPSNLDEMLQQYQPSFVAQKYIQLIKENV